MKRDQITSSRDLADAGIELKLHKRMGVKLKLPCPKLYRRLTQVLLLVKMNPGQVSCTVMQYYPEVLATHPWLKAKYDPASKAYHLTIRSEFEVFECILQTQTHQYTTEVTAAFAEIVAEICTHGWFGKRELAQKPTVVPTQSQSKSTELSDRPRVTIVPHSAAAPAPAMTVMQHALYSWLQAAREVAEPTSSEEIDASVPKPVALTTTVEVAPKPVVTSAPTPTPAAPKSSPTFVETVAAWLTEADQLISQNEKRIAELDDKLKQEIAAIRIKYIDLTDDLKAEIENIKRVRQQFVGETETEEAEHVEAESAKMLSKPPRVKGIIIDSSTWFTNMSPQ